MYFEVAKFSPGGLWYPHVICSTKIEKATIEWGGELRHRQEIVRLRSLQALSLRTPLDSGGDIPYPSPLVQDTDVERLDSCKHDLKAPAREQKSRDNRGVQLV